MRQSGSGKTLRRESASRGPLGIGVWCLAGRPNTLPRSPKAPTCRSPERSRRAASSAEDGAKKSVAEIRVHRIVRRRSTAPRPPHSRPPQQSLSILVTREQPRHVSGLLQLIHDRYSGGRTSIFQFVYDPTACVPDGAWQHRKIPVLSSSAIPCTSAGFSGLMRHFSPFIIHDEHQVRLETKLRRELGDQVLSLLNDDRRHSPKSRWRPVGEAHERRLQSAL